jgi:hypothetical protein
LTSDLGSAEKQAIIAIVGVEKKVGQVYGSMENPGISDANCKSAPVAKSALCRIDLVTQLHVPSSVQMMIKITIVPRKPPPSLTAPYPESKPLNRLFIFFF